MFQWIKKHAKRKLLIFFWIIWTKIWYTRGNKHRGVALLLAVLNHCVVITHEKYYSTTIQHPSARDPYHIGSQYTTWAVATRQIAHFHLAISKKNIGLTKTTFIMHIMWSAVYGSRRESDHLVHWLELSSGPNRMVVSSLLIDPVNCN
jgi:hypothetical protein